MKIEIELEKTTFMDLECVKLTDKNGETLYIFSEQGIRYFTRIM